MVDEDAVLCFQKGFDEFEIFVGSGILLVRNLAHVLGRVHVIGGCLGGVISEAVLGIVLGSHAVVGLKLVLLLEHPQRFGFVLLFHLV